MSHVKLFSTITDSSMWDQPDRVCKIWITMLAMADWHGCVYASLPGLANRARKSIQEVEEALAIFRAPDPYSRSKEQDGRRIVDIDGGWMLLTYRKHREARNAEALRESKREWAARNRASKEVEESRTTTNDVDAPVTKSNERRINHSVSVVSDLDLRSDPDPEGVQGEAELDAAAAEYVEDMATAEVFDKAVVWDGGPVPADEAQPFPDSQFDAVDVPSHRPVFKDLGDWKPDESLIAGAVMAGLPREYFLERIEDLRLGPIGGKRGTFDRTDFVRKLIPKWRKWYENERGNAPTTATAVQVVGYPPWVRTKHQEFAKKHDLNLKSEAKRFIKASYHHPRNLQPGDAASAFTKHLEKVVACNRET